jgi:magnesium transporter
MQRVLYTKQIGELEPYIDKRVLDYIFEEQVHAFESFAEFTIISFDWYDISNRDTVTSQMLMYLDKEDLFILCENQMSYEKAVSVFKEKETNEQALLEFFTHLLKTDMLHLDEIEDKIIEADDAVLINSKQNYLRKIVEFRRELLNLKRYYEQFLSILEDLTANENALLTQDAIRRCDILENRINRYYANVVNMQDHVSQMREAYQAQIDIEQNQIMKIFTIVTVIFMPLTLLVGWYGMNLQMPEFHWQYAYPVVIVVSLVVVVGLYTFFKKKKWF